MGRKKISVWEEIVDDRVCRVTFKKRRIGLIKKSMQLSKLSGALVQLKIYNPKDQSLIEYHSSNAEHDFNFNHLSREAREVSDYARFDNSHYDIINEIDERVTKHGNTATRVGGDRNEEEKEDLHERLERDCSAVNPFSLFSLAKKYVSPTLVHELDESQDPKVGSKRSRERELIVQIYCSDKSSQK